MNTFHSEQLFQTANSLFPGGVNSPVRAFKGIDGTPRFFSKGQGAVVVDADENQYIDYVQSWGPLVVGHAHPRVVAAIQDTAQNGTSFGAPTYLENELATLIRSHMPSLELMRFVSSGTEATMSALRLARAYTQRDLFVKFAGGYHGHADAFLAQAGSGVATFGLPDSPGIPREVTENTLVLDLNDIEGVKKAFEHYKNKIAAVFIEPLPANMGVIPLKKEFLHTLRQLCTEQGTLLVFDEVITGFRVHLGGAQALWDIQPDLTCLGKVIGGGLPVAAYGGKKSILSLMAPVGPVYQAGTLSGNPLSMAAGLATLTVLGEKGTFQSIAEKAAYLVQGFQRLASQYRIPLQTTAVGTVFGLFFLQTATDDLQPIKDYASAKRHCDTARYSRFAHYMMEKGFYFAPSAFEAGFVSAAHQTEQIEETLRAFEAFLQLETR